MTNEEAYIKQLEEHIKNLNNIVDTLLKKEPLLYYIVPKEEYTFCIETTKIFHKTVEDVF